MIGGAGHRICPACGASSPIAEREAVWPVGWDCPACRHVAPVIENIPMFAPALANTMTGMDPANFVALWRVEATHFWFRCRSQLLTGLLDQYFPRASSFLEIGCGNGIVLDAVSHIRKWARLCGSELHPSALAFARQRLDVGIELVQMDARNIPAEGAFDIIGAFDVLEHIKEDEAVLEQMARSVRRGGGVIIAVPQHPFLWSIADDIALHVRRYRRGEMEKKLVSAGFRILRSTSYTSFLFPAMVASRLMRRDQNNADSFEAEFRLSKGMNRIFMDITAAEVRLTLAGISWPFGGSRVVVAQRV